MSTVIVITPPPKKPEMTAEVYEHHMREKRARLDREMRALQEAGFTVTMEALKVEREEEEKEEEKDDN